MADDRQIASDIDELRNLATELTALAGKIEGMGAELERGLGVLGQTFRDEEYARFCDVFRGAKLRLAGFTEEVRGVVPKLIQDADTLAAGRSVRLD